LGGGNRYNTVESPKIGAKIDKITEKRQFPMDFSQNFSLINFAYQQIEIIKMEYNAKIFGQKTQFIPYS
jgi:hypothetical protein